MYKVVYHDSYKILTDRSVADKSLRVAKPFKLTAAAVNWQ